VEAFNVKSKLPDNKRRVGLLLLVLSSAFVHGCVPPATQNQNGGGNATGPCAGRTYFNSDFRFGFDPPSDYSGPLFTLSNIYNSLPLVRGYFVAPLLANRRVDVEVFTSVLDLNGFVSRIRTQRLFAGAFLISSEDFTTDGGAPATFLVWSSAQTVLYEAFSARGNTIFALNAQLSFIDASFVDSDIRASFRTLCVDTTEDTSSADDQSATGG
jgi:hypothetical protein